MQGFVWRESRDVVVLYICTFVPVMLRAMIPPVHVVNGRIPELTTKGDHPGLVIFIGDHPSLRPMTVVPSGWPVARMQSSEAVARSNDASVVRG
eukprot:1181688-Amphidinium_carterae.1